LDASSRPPPGDADTDGGDPDAGDSEGDGGDTKSDGGDTDAGDGDTGGGDSNGDPAPADWWDPQWRSRIKITFTNAGGGELNNFPVLIRLNSGAVEFARVGAGGSDIRFVDPNHEELNYEIETWDGANLAAALWAKVPTVDADSSADFVWLYFNNSAAPPHSRTDVWDPDYEAVWPLHDHLLDASGKGNNGTNNSSADILSVIAHGQSFDGTATNSIGAGASTGITNIFDGGGSVSVWITPLSFGGGDNGRILDKADANLANDGWLLNLNNTNVTETFGFTQTFSGGAGFWVAPDNALTAGDTFHIAVSYDSSSPANTPLLYINGIAASLTQRLIPSGTATDDSALQLWIGNCLAANRAFDGVIDEVRLSRRARSEAWFHTSYRSQRPGSTFANFGGEDRLSP